MGDTAAFSALSTCSAFVVLRFMMRGSAGGDTDAAMGARCRPVKIWPCTAVTALF